MSLPSYDSFPAINIPQDRTYRLISTRLDLLLMWADAIERRRCWFYWWVARDLEMRANRAEYVRLVTDAAGTEVCP